jgi:hypothetical protein
VLTFWEALLTIVLIRFVYRSATRLVRTKRPDAPEGAVTQPGD